MRFVLICSRSYRDERPRRAGGGEMRSIVLGVTTRGTHASGGDHRGPSAGATHSGACVTGILARALALAVVATALAASTAQASVSMCNVPITMGDGAVLSANIFLPSTTGQFPTILTATGYNKDAANPTGQDCEASQGIAGDEPGLTEKGYAVMVFDDRGTGGSGGKWESWDQRTQDDYKEVLSWIQAQSWSNGSVATTGQSYMGITSFLMAEADVARVAEGGWWDLFQRGEPLLWESLKHSPDRVLFMSPHYHIGSGPEMEDPKLKEKWFAHWLLGVENGVQKTPKINLYPINGTHWEHFTKFPLPKTSYQRLHLSGEPSGSGAISLHDGSLASSAPSAEGGEEAPLLPASSPCSRETAQWTAGAASTSACDTNNATYEASSLTYTTAPLATDMKFTGLI